MRVGKPRVEENEKTKWEVSSRCFSFLELIASNILSSRFHFFFGADHVVYGGQNYHS